MAWWGSWLLPLAAGLALNDTLLPGQPRQYLLRPGEIALARFASCSGNEGGMSDGSTV